MQVQLQCQIHHQQPLDLVCLSANCPNKGLICYLCKHQSHLDHSLILPLKLFLTFFLQRKAGGQQFARDIAKIDQQLIQIQMKLRQLHKKLVIPNMVEQAFLNFRNQTIKDISHFDQVITNLQSLIKKEGENHVQEFNSWIKQHGDLYEEEEEGCGKVGVYTGFLRNKLTFLNGIYQKIERFNEIAAFQDSQVTSLFQIIKNTKMPKLHFSEELKGACMTILSPTKASMTTSGTQRMMLLQPRLDGTTSIKKWKVKIQKMASWVGVGISHYDSVKSVNFDFSYTSANHGNYLISSNGYSWNGYKMQYNSKYQTFQFTTNDIIELVYDPCNHKVTFKKQNNEQVFTYDVDPNQKPIHASINMTGIGDCVEILL